jgi:hypothetical protein
LVLRLSWIRVAGDLVGWVPLARFPALGDAPLDRAGIAARLAQRNVYHEERDEHLARLLDSIRLGPASEAIQWKANEGGPTFAVEHAMLVSMLTLQPKFAWAFGRYFVDSQPAWTPTDYLVVGAWITADRRPNTTTAALGVPTTVSSAMPIVTTPLATMERPFEVGGPALDDLIEALERYPGLLYFAPCYAVTKARAWEPAFAELNALETISGEVRRQLDAHGRAALELPLRANWSLRRTDHYPLLAVQQTPLARVEFAGPGVDRSPRVVASSADSGRNRTIVEVATPLVAELPGSAQLSLTALDLFGHLAGPPSTRSVPLPANLYPIAPPPIGVYPEIVPPANSGSPDLRVSWLWGGRLRLFHPGVHGFQIEWLQDSDLPAGVAPQEALRSTNLNWRVLPRVAPVPPRPARIDVIETELAGLSTTAVLLREGNDWIAGLRTDLRAAAGATGRFDGWEAQLSGRSFAVRRHTVGDNIWLYLALPAGAQGTPFSALKENEEQVFSQSWVLQPPAAAPVSNAVACVSGVAGNLQLLVPGSLITQGPFVFGVLAMTPGTPVRALFDVTPGPQEPGGPPPARPLPTVGDVEFDAPMTSLVAGVTVASPTPAHARREIWVRVRTVDSLDRPGAPGPATSAAWTKAVPPVPAEGPTVVRRSPPDAFGRCKLLVRFDRSLADHGCVLSRASDTQLAVVLERAKRAIASRPVGAAVPAFAPLPPGFAWPVGGPQRIEDVRSPIADFATLPDMMRVFCNELAIDEGAPAGPRRVFPDAFERRGRMTRPGQTNQIFAAADNAPMELEDVVDRAGNRYLYLVRFVDRAAQEGGVSGVSLPGQGWNIAAPAPPDLLPVLVTSDELIIRWRPVLDARVTRYRVTRTPTWSQAPAATVVEKAPNDFSSPIRLEGDRISLPDLVIAPAATRVTSVRTLADGVEHLADGFVIAAEQQFVWWCASGNRALLVVTPVAAGDIRNRVPAEYAFNVPDGSAVDPRPLALYRGVLDGKPLGFAPGTFGALLAQTGETLIDRTATGAWYDSGFLMAPGSFEENEAVVLEMEASDGTRRTFGRCPAAPGHPAIAVTAGVIPLTAVAARLGAGDRPSGLFRAAAVTGATGGAPDPRRSGATDFIDAATWYTAGFVRRLRNGVPMVLRWRRLSDSSDRFLTTLPGNRPLRFLDGSLVVPAWDPTRELLSGVYERATVHVTGQTVVVEQSARNMVADVTAEAGTGRIVTALPDRMPLRVRRRDGSELVTSFEPLVWRRRRLAVRGLLADGVFDLGALHTFEPNAAGQLVPRTDRDRSAFVDLAPDRTELVAKNVPAEASQIQLEYDADGVARTTDPHRLELSVPLTAADVGRTWEIRLEALCDFPNPVGVVASRPSITRAEVVPPSALDVRITSAAWTVGRVLEVQYAGPPNLRYRVTAISRTSGRRYVLADPAAGGIVSTAVAADGTPVPVTEAFTIELRGTYPNAAQAYFAAPAEVDALMPADVR